MVYLLNMVDLSMVMLNNQMVDLVIWLFTSEKFLELCRMIYGVNFRTWWVVLSSAWRTRMCVYIYTHIMAYLCMHTHTFWFLTLETMRWCWGCWCAGCWRCWCFRCWWRLWHLDLAARCLYNHPSHPSGTLSQGFVAAIVSLTGFKACPKQRGLPSGKLT